MIGEHTRMWLLHLVECSIPDERLVEELERVFAGAGGPPKVWRPPNDFASHMLTANLPICSATISPVD